MSSVNLRASDNVCLCQLPFKNKAEAKPVWLVLVLTYLYHAGLSADILFRNIAKNIISKNYFVCVLLSCVLCTFGLICGEPQTFLTSSEICIVICRGASVNV